MEEKQEHEEPAVDELIYLPEVVAAKDKKKARLLIEQRVAYYADRMGIAYGRISMRNQRTMLMYGKEASNRKQEIDRQHYTIPNQRPKDKHCGKI